ncbi:MAG: hypothetical protein PWR21_1983 [Methanoculleus sp.]|jgi:hypothetical protein|nr:hypothetical protein [Methanoculleus sp.]
MKKESAMSGMSKVAGPLQEIDPREIEMIMSRINFPASKRELIARAQDSGASQGILETVNLFAERRYNSMDEIRSELRRIRRR